MCVNYKLNINPVLFPALTPARLSGAGFIFHTVIFDMGNEDVGNVLSEIADTKRQQKRNQKDPQQIREVLPFREWVESSYHSGPISNSIYPFWKENLIKFFEGGYNELIISGGKGSGKTAASAIALLYKVYEFSCYEYPQRILGLADSSDITFAYFNVKYELARSTGYSEIEGFVEETPYFQEKFSRDPNYSKQIILPNNLYIKFGSSASSVRGDNCVIGICDEANFYRTGGSGSMGDVQRIRQIANDLVERRKTRFQYKGEDPGFLGIISSSTHAQSYIEQRKNKAGDKALHVKAVSYKVRPWQNSTLEKNECVNKSLSWADVPDSEKAWVFKGDEDTQPEIVESMSDFKRIITKNEFSQIEWSGDSVHEAILSLSPNHRTNFVSVPADLKKQFEDDLISSLQGIAGIPVGSKGDFFNSDDAWSQCVSNKIPFAFNRKEPVLSTGDSVTLDDYFNKEKMLKKVDGYYEPKINPEKKRFIHIDLSSTKDPSGMAMCHISGFRDDEGEQPILTFDFMVRIKPPSPPDRLSHEKVRKFVRKLKKQYGYRIDKIGMDRYSSESNLQWFNKHVVPKPEATAKKDKGAVYQSTDRDDEIWRDFSSLMHNDGVRFNPYEVFRQELFALEHDREKRKVDHPKEFTDGSTGHNDVSCAVVGAANLAMTSEDYYTHKTDEGVDLFSVEGGADTESKKINDQYGVHDESDDEAYVSKLEDDIIELIG